MALYTLAKKIIIITEWRFADDASVHRASPSEHSKNEKLPMPRLACASSALLPNPILKRRQIHAVPSQSGDFYETLTEQHAFI